MKDRIWLITGISSGLGEALSQTVMDAGDFVVGTFRSKEQADDFNVKNRDRGKAFLLDLKEVNDIQPLIERIVSEFNRIDVLVNNAGVGFVGAVEETSVEEMRTVFEVNVFAPFQLTRSVLPHMRRRKNGRIIQISSHGGVKSFAGFGIYNASKFALEGFSEALADEVAPLGIRVTIVEPGPFRTNFAGKGLVEAEVELDDYAKTAGTFRTMLKGVHGSQEGDPVKAAVAILDHINTENASLRLPLGRTALKSIGMKAEMLKADLELNREIAERAVFD